MLGRPRDQRSGIALTAAKTIGPFATGLTRTVAGSYTAVVIAVAASCALAAVAAAHAGPVPDRAPHAGGR